MNSGGEREGVTVADLSGMSTEELQSLLREADGVTAPPVDKPLANWSTEELSRALANPPSARITVRPQHTEMLPPQSQREAGEPLKPSFEAVGGTIGGILGASAGGGLGLLGGPAAPVTSAGGALAGSVLGSAAGTAAGAGAYDIYRDVSRGVRNLLGVEPDRTTPPTTSERLTGPLGDAAVDAAVSGGIAGLPAVGAAGRSLGRKFFGLDTPAAQRAITDAANTGVEVGIHDVSPKAYSGVVMRTVGQMPILNIPGNIQYGRKFKQIEGAWKDSLDQIATSKDVGDIGRGLVGAGTATYDADRQAVSGLYKSANNQGIKEGAIFDSTPVKKAAQDAEFELMSRRPTLAGGTEMTSTGVPEYIKKFLEEAQQLPPKLTLKEMDGIDSAIRSHMAKAKENDNFQWAQAKTVMDAIKDSITQQLPTSAAARTWMAADDAFGRMKQKFGGPVGQRFGRVDKNIFQPGYEVPGTIHSDEAMGSIVNWKSPEALQELERIAGKAPVLAAGRRRIEDAFTRATGTTSKGEPKFEADSFMRALHLNNPNSGEYQALKHLYASNGGDVEDLRRLAEVTKRVYEHAPSSVSSFLARKSVFGAGAASGAALTHLFGGMVADVLALPGAASMGALHFISSPVRLRALMRVSDPNVPQVVRRQLAARLVRMLSNEGSERRRAAAPREAPPVLDSGNALVDSRKVPGNALVGQ